MGGCRKEAVYSDFSESVSNSVSDPEVQPGPLIADVGVLLRKSHSSKCPVGLGLTKCGRLAEAAKVGKSKKNKRGRKGSVVEGASRKVDGTKIVPESSNSLNHVTLQEALDAERILRIKKKNGVTFRVPDGPILDRLVNLEKVDVDHNVYLETLEVDQ